MPALRHHHEPGAERDSKRAACHQSSHCSRFQGLPSFDNGSLTASDNIYPQG